MATFEIALEKSALTEKGKLPQIITMDSLKNALSVKSCNDFKHDQRLFSFFQKTTKTPQIFELTANLVVKCHIANTFANNAHKESTHIQIKNMLVVDAVLDEDDNVTC